ncbi:MAG: AEC family transporter [Candidatus Thiodiazotropha sp.]
MHANLYQATDIKIHVYAIVTSLLPILSLILLGLLLKQIRFIPDEAWSGIERLTYFLLFPALLIQSLGQQRLDGVPWREMLFVIVGVLFVASLLLVLGYRFRASVPGATFSSVFQGGVRFNTYIALALAQAFFGQQGLALAAVASGFMIVLINLLCISALYTWGDNRTQRRRGMAGEVLGNPLITACLVGWALSLSGIGLPGPSDEVLEIIGRAALPLGLLAVGAALRPRALHGHMGATLAASLVQFGVKPLVTAGLITVTGLTGSAAGVLVIAFMTPTAPSAYILARQLGGDTHTMASIITLQTLLGFAVMPLIAILMLN